MPNYPVELLLAAVIIVIAVLGVAQLRTPPKQIPGQNPAGVNASDQDHAGQVARKRTSAVLNPAAWIHRRRNRDRRRGAYRSLITGADNRYSTSKSIAVAWTIVVAWMVVADAFAAAFPHAPGTFSGLLSHASDLYFVFLGGPFAAAAFAKASVATKIDQGLLAKTPGTPSASDLISDDNGNPDLYDFQYVLFNVLALLITIVSFSAHPGAGPPGVPDFLAILTGGSALTYTVNKAIATSAPTIVSVIPQSARIGDVISVTGVQLFSAVSNAPIPTVTIGTVPATGVAFSTTSSNALTAIVAQAPAGNFPLTGNVDVVISTPLASPIIARNAVTIVPDGPAVIKVKPQPITAGAAITVTGSLLLEPGTPYASAAPGTGSIGGVTPSLVNAAGVNWPVTVEGPYSDGELTLRIGAEPAAADPAGASGTPAETMEAGEGTAVTTATAATVAVATTATATLTLVRDSFTLTAPVTYRLT